MTTGAPSATTSIDLPSHTVHLWLRPRSNEESVKANLIPTILARYLGCAPDAVNLRYGTHGKPFLDPDPGIYFNRSHNRRWDALAVSLDPVGLDIEWPRWRPRLRQIANRYFGSFPADILDQLSYRHAKPAIEAFYTHWVIREAWIKYFGGTLFTTATPSFASPDLDRLNDSLWLDLCDRSPWLSLHRHTDGHLLGLCSRKQKSVQMMP